MSRTAHNAALGLASLGLLSGSLIAAGPALADPSRSDSREVDSKTCLKSDHDKECKSRTKLEADERGRRGERNRNDEHGRDHRSEWKTVKLSADVDFFQRKFGDHNGSDDHSRFENNNSRNGFGKSDHDLGEVDFQFWDNHRDEWKTLATKDVDKNGEADVTVKIKVRHHDEVKVRADYSGVEDQIKGSTSRTVEID